MCTQWLPIVCLPFLKLHFLLLKAVVCVQLMQVMSSVRVGVESDLNIIMSKLLIQASTFSAGGNVILDEGFNAKLCGVHI